MMTNLVTYPKLFKSVFVLRSMCVGMLMMLVMVPSAYGGFIDFFPEDEGTQSGSWSEPTTLMVFIPAGITGADKTALKMGIQDMANALQKISVQFKDGEPPANAGDNIVDIDVVTGTTPPPFGIGGAEIFLPNGQDHGTLSKGTIKIMSQALGSVNMMKNLGAHEFGHVLGLEHVDRTGATRVDVMDDDFNSNDPYVSPSAGDRMMLAEHYMIPEPGVGVMMFVGLIGMMRRRGSV